MSTKLKSTLLILFSVICVSVWGIFFTLLLGQANSGGTAQNTLIEKNDRSLLIWDSSKRSEIESTDRGAPLSVISLTNANDNVKVGDAISYGNGVSIDELLKFFQVNE